MAEQFSNAASSTLATAIGSHSAGDEVTFDVTDESLFPDSGDFRVVINGEIFKVTDVDDETFTATASPTDENNSTPRTHEVGSAVVCVLTKGAITADRLGYVGPSTQMPAHQAPTLWSAFQSGHGWTTTGAVASSNLNDTTDYVLGSQSAQVTSTGAGSNVNIRKLGMTAKDVTAKVFRILVKFDNLDNLVALQLYLGSSSFAHFYISNIYSATTDKVLKEGEWQWLDFHLFASGASSTTGSPSLSNITDVQLRATDDGTGPVTLHVNAIGFVDQPSTFPNGVVSIAFDDSLLTTFTEGRKKLDEYGFPATAYVIADRATDASYMTLAQLKELHQLHGWEIAGHCYASSTHTGNGFLDLTEAELDEELYQLKVWLYKNGFGDSGNLAYPFGGYDATVEAIVKRYFSTARTVYQGPRQVLPPVNPMRLRSLSVTQSTTTTLVTNTIDEAYTHGHWFILTMHDLVTTPSSSAQYSIANFATIIDYLATKGIPVRTVRDVLRAA